MFQGINLVSRFLYVTVAPLTLLCLAVAASLYSGKDIGFFTRDPTTVADVPPYTGFISSFGVLFWWSSATIAFGVGVYIRNQPEKHRWSRFLGFFGVFSAFLVMDDLFLFHESVLPKLFGIGEKAVFAIYGAMLVSLLMVYRDLIRSTESFYLWLALSFFALSLGIDRLPEDLLPYHFLFEDGFKFLGISAWLAFSVETAYLQLTKRFGPNHI